MRFILLYVFFIPFAYITNAKEFTFIDTAFTYMMEGNYRDCISYSSMCKYRLQKSNEVDVDKKIFTLNGYMGYSYDNLNIIDSSLILRLENRNLSKKSTSISDMDYISNEINIGAIYWSSNPKLALESFDLALACIDKVTDKCRWKYTKTNMYSNTYELPLVLVILNYKSLLYASLGDKRNEIKCMNECMSIANKMEQIDKIAYFNFLNSYRNSLKQKRKYSKKYFREIFSVTSKCVDLLINYMPEKLVKMTTSQRNIYLKEVQNEMTDMRKSLSIGFEHYEEKSKIAYDIALWNKNLTIDIKNYIDNLVIQSRDSVLQKDIEFLEYIKSNLILDDSIIKKIKEWELNVTHRLSLIEHPEVKFNYSWKDVQNALKEDEIAIEIENFGYLYYHVSMIRKGWKHPLLDCDFDFHKPEKIGDFINEFYGKQLIGVDKIYLSMSGDFNKYPVETYWEQKFQNQKVYRVSSTKVLCSRNEKIQTDNNITLFGGLNYTQSPIKNVEDSIAVVRSGAYELPETLIEVNKIEELARIYNYRVFKSTKDEGSEYFFRMSKNRKIIHLATHGFYTENINDLSEKTLLHQYITKRQNEFNYDAFDIALYRSGLLFSGANDALLGKNDNGGEFDGILTAKEISNMNLSNTDLLVLSACESGLGAIGYDGVWGLPIAFKMAGVKTILFSLWKVDDSATQILMVEFYKNYFNGMTKKMSLKKAQEYVKSQPGFEDPYYWAGFVLLDALD